MKWHAIKGDAWHYIQCLIDHVSMFNNTAWSLGKHKNMGNIKINNKNHQSTVICESSPHVCADMLFIDVS